MRTKSPPKSFSHSNATEEKIIKSYDNFKPELSKLKIPNSTDYNEVSLFYDQEYHVMNAVSHEIEECKEIHKFHKEKMEEIQKDLSHKIENLHVKNENSDQSYELLKNYIENGSSEDKRFDFNPGSQPIEIVQKEIKKVNNFVNKQQTSLTFNIWKEKLDNINKQIEWLEFMISISNNPEISQNIEA